MKHATRARSAYLIKGGIATLFLVAQLPFAFVGSAAAASNSTNSDFKFDLSTSSNTAVENDTEVSIENETSQTAVSGSVTLEDVKKAGDIVTGDARNENVTEAAIAVAAQTDIPAAEVAAPTTGHHNRHSGSAGGTEFKVENDTEIRIYNHTNQTAVSGSIEINDVKQVGNITTGDATNENCTSIRLAIVAGSALGNWPTSACTPEEPATPPVIPPVVVVPEEDDQGEVLGTTTSTPPAAQPATTQSAATGLANTGAEALIGLFAALNIIGLTGATALASKKQ